MRIEKKKRRSNAISINPNLSISSAYSPSSDDIQFISATPSTQTRIAAVENNDDVQIIGIVHRRPVIQNLVEIISPTPNSQRRQRPQVFHG